MFYLIVGLISVITFLLQVSVLPQLAVLHVALNIVVLVALFWLIFISQRFAVTFALVMGLLLDIFSAAFFGSFAIALVATIFILKRIIDLYFQKESVLSTLFLQVIGIIIFNGIFELINVGAGFLGLSHATFTPSTFFIYIVPISAVWAALATLLLFKFFKRLSSVVEYFQERTRS